MSSDASDDLTSISNETKVRTVHTPKSSLYISSTFKGMTPDGRYIHLTKYGRVTYHPGYYAIDGRLLQSHY
jgi:hypothetical protein